MTLCRGLLEVSAVPQLRPQTPERVLRTTQFTNSGSRPKDSGPDENKGEQGGEGSEGRLGPPESALRKVSPENPRHQEAPNYLVILGLQQEQS